MKHKAFIYFWLQLKRNAKMLPRVLALTLALFIIAAVAGANLYHRNENDESKQVITVGIVSEDKSKMVEACISAMSTLDSSRYSVKIVKMTEEEAKDSLLGGAISGYIIVPVHYVRDVYNGKDVRLRYVSIGGASGLGMVLINEMIDHTADVVLESANAIYGTQYYVEDFLPQKNASDEGDRLFERYAALMLTRRELFSLKEIGVSGHATMMTYLISGLMIVFLLLWGVSASPLFRRNAELSCMLGVRGLGAVGQIAGEAGAYTALMVLCMLPIFVLTKILLGFFHEAEDALAPLLTPRFIALYFLGAFMLCMMQLFLYELSRNGISAPLLQFFNAMVQGYICGCFYPQSFFPDKVRAVAEHLPVGVSVRLLGEASVASVTGTLVYAVLFFAAAVWLRRRLLNGWEA